MPLSQIVPLKYLLPSSRLQACHLLLPCSSSLIRQQLHPFMRDMQTKSLHLTSFVSFIMHPPSPPFCSPVPCFLLYRRTQRTLDRHTGICSQSVSHVLMDRNQSSQVRTPLPSSLFTAPLSTVRRPLMASHLHCPSISPSHRPLVTFILTRFPVHSTPSSSLITAGAVFGSVPHIVQVDDYVDTLAFKVQCLPAVPWHALRNTMCTTSCTYT